MTTNPEEKEILQSIKEIWDFVMKRDYPSVTHIAKRSDSKGDDRTDFDNQRCINLPRLFKGDRR